MICSTAITVPMYDSFCCSVAPPIYVCVPLLCCCIMLLPCMFHSTAPLLCIAALANVYYVTHTLTINVTYYIILNAVPVLYLQLIH